MLYLNFAIGTELKFYHLDKDELCAVQNNFINVTFWMDVSKCKDTNSSYRVRVRTRTNTGSLEYDGTMTYWRDTCTERAQRSVRCISPTGPAELYRRVNHSHEQVEWELMTQYGDFTLMRKKINVLCTYIISILRYILFFLAF